MQVKRQRSKGYQILSVIILLFTQSAFAQVANERVSWTTSKVVGSPTTPEPYRVELAFPEIRFKLPTSLEEFPSGEQLLVTEIGGKVWAFPNKRDKNVRRLVGDLGNVALFDAE
ncbi:MAG: hypothetical protein ABGX22_06865, partial [Pirellulaceae bacterium]